MIDRSFNSLAEMIFLLFFVWQCFSFLIYEVKGKEKLPRFVIEEDVKPAIFGSYRYNLLTQTFDISNDTTSNEPNVIQIQIFNRTITQTQVTSSPEPPVRLFKKHVAVGMPKIAKTFNWRPSFLRNKSNSSKVTTIKLKIQDIPTKDA